MNRKFVFSTALVAGLLPVAMFAQTSPAPAQPAAPAAQQPAPPPPPSAFPAKIALIDFEQAVIATNEGQQAMAELQKKYEPKQKQFEALNTEIENLKKQAEAGRATMSADEYASRAKTIDTKQKQLDRDVEDTRTAFQSDQQEAYAKVAQKVDVVMRKYVADNGYTILLNVGTQEPLVMWIAETPQFGYLAGRYPGLQRGHSEYHGAAAVRALGHSAAFHDSGNPAHDYPQTGHQVTLRRPERQEGLSLFLAFSFPGLILWKICGFGDAAY